MESTLKSFAQNIPNNDEVCSVCGAKILRTAEFMGIKRTFRVMCKCMQKQQEEKKSVKKTKNECEKSKSLNVFPYLASGTKTQLLKTQKQVLIRALTELLKGAENTANYAKKQSKTDTAFIFLVIKEQAKRI